MMYPPPLEGNKFCDPIMNRGYIIWGVTHPQSLLDRLVLTKPWIKKIADGTYARNGILTAPL